MFIVYIVGWMLLILVVGGWLVGRQRRKAEAGMKGLAASFGFRLLENMEAVDRSIVPAMRQAALEAREKMPAFFRKMAERPARGFLCVAGVADGIEVSIFLESIGSGKTETKYTVVRADYPKPLSFEMRIGAEGAFTRLGKALFELRDVEIGDPEFDRAVRVKTADDAVSRQDGRRRGRTGGTRQAWRERCGARPVGAVDVGLCHERVRAMGGAGLPLRPGEDARAGGRGRGRRANAWRGLKTPPRGRRTRADSQASALRRRSERAPAPAGHVCSDCVRVCREILDGRRAKAEDER